MRSGSINDNANLLIGVQARQDLGTMISTFCSREELDAAMNDEFLPPFAEAELADPELLPDIPSASVTWMQEYENRLAHVREVLQARQAKAAKAAQPLGPKRGRGRPRKNGPLPSPAVRKAANRAKKRKSREKAAATLTMEQLAAQKVEEAARKMRSRSKIAEKLSKAERAARTAKENQKRNARNKERREKVKAEKLKALLAECQRLLEDD